MYRFTIAEWFFATANSAHIPRSANKIVSNGKEILNPKNFWVKKLEKDIANAAIP